MSDERICLLTRKPLCKAMNSPKYRLPVEMKVVMKVHVICDFVRLPGYKGNDGVIYRFRHLNLITCEWSICSEILKE